MLSSYRNEDETILAKINDHWPIAIGQFHYIPILQFGIKYWEKNVAILKTDDFSLDHLTQAPLYSKTSSPWEAPR